MDVHCAHSTLRVLRGTDESDGNTDRALKVRCLACDELLDIGVLSKDERELLDRLGVVRRIGTP